MGKSIFVFHLEIGNDLPEELQMIEIDRTRCVKCGACVRDCMVEILKPSAEGFPAVEPELERFCLNCQHCLAICPKGALTCHGVKPEQCAAPGVLPSPDAMFDLLRQRRSVRQFEDENLPADVLEKLKASLAWSPTGCNDHRLFFTVIEDKADMEFFRAETARMLKLLIRSGLMRLIYPNYKRYLQEILSGKDVVFRNAPHLIAAATPSDAPCREADPWIALSYFDLFAQSVGIGTCWCGFGVQAFRWNRKLRNRRHLPSGYRIGAVLLFGKPSVRYARATVPEPYGFGRA